MSQRETWNTSVEQNALNTAFEKIRGEGRAPDLLPAESKALKEYLNRINAKSDREEFEDVLCKRIRAVLMEQAVAARNASTAGAKQERKNSTLRSSINLFLHRQYSAVEEADVLRLRATGERLAQMAASETPSPNEVRLAKLIAGCLTGYNTWRKEAKSQ